MYQSDLMTLTLVFSIGQLGVSKQINYLIHLNNRSIMIIRCFNLCTRNIMHQINTTIKLLPATSTGLFFLNKSQSMSRMQYRYLYVLTKYLKSVQRLKLEKVGNRQTERVTFAFFYISVDKWAHFNLRTQLVQSRLKDINAVFCKLLLIN